MQTLTQEALMQLCMNFLFFFVIGSFGAFLKDLYETITKKNDPIRFSVVLIGGASAAFICMGLQDTWLSGLSLNAMMLVTFICGILGFELFGNITTISKFKKTLEMIISLKNRIRIDIIDPASFSSDEGASEDTENTSNKKSKNTSTNRKQTKKEDVGK